ncbi:MAG: hypothetical protein NC218_05700 [Acetobacter sp.]|nr:hypothetical protein [Acetobacter sp.]
MKRFYAYMLYIVACLTLCGCAKKPVTMFGSDGHEIPMVFQNFPDIPFPDNSYMNLEDSKTMGNGENWIGSISYTSMFNAGRVFDYYVSEMPKKGWVEIAVVRARISQMTYVKNGRAVQILIQMEGDDSSFVTITAVPNQATVKLLTN